MFHSAPPRFTLTGPVDTNGPSIAVLHDGLYLLSNRQSRFVKVPDGSQRNPDFGASARWASEQIIQECPHPNLCQGRSR
jgi:hypothetical protein